MNRSRNSWTANNDYIFRQYLLLSKMRYMFLHFHWVNMKHMHKKVNENN